LELVEEVKEEEKVIPSTQAVPKVKKVIKKKAAPKKVKAPVSKKVVPPKKPEKFKIIHFLRHGQAMHNLEPSVDTFDSHLTELGIE
jgi:hypothetical protein